MFIWVLETNNAPSVLRRTSRKENRHQETEVYLTFDLAVIEQFQVSGAI